MKNKSSDYLYNIFTSNLNEDVKNEDIKHKIKQKYKQAKLIEPGTAFYVSNMLTQCNYKKKIYSNIILNIVLFILFIIIVSITLYYANVNKNNKIRYKDDIEYKKHYAYIEFMKKIKYYDKKRKSEMISHIPFESKFHRESKMFL
jgi:hypothetical protein